MWQAMRLSQKASPNFVRTAEELMQQTSRSIIVATGILYLVWHLVATLTWPTTIGWRTWLVTPLIAMVCALSLSQLPKRPLLAQGIWLLGLLASVTLAILVLQQARIALAYALLPLMAVVTIGWPAGLLMHLLVAAVLWWLAGSRSPQPLPLDLLSQVLLSGFVAGIVGWAASDALLTVVQWSLYSFRSANESMEAARTHRAQLARVLKDLDQAYYRLERANSALIAAWKAADEAEHFKAELATNVSHELRTPLNLIVGFAEIMMTSPESYGGVPIPGPYRSDLNAIYNSAQHLLSLVDDVLDLARLDAGRVPLTRGRVEVLPLIEEAVGMIADYIAAKGLELRVHVADDIPPLWIDHLRIRQVLLNLLVNAARFTDKGSITVEAVRQGTEVVVRVTDTGRGIRNEDLPHVFQEFRSAEHSRSGWHSGTGLGLPISKKLVDLHQGRMGVDSIYLQGASFWFTLPCTAPAEEEAARPLGRAHPVGHIRDEERIIVAVHRDTSVVRMLQRHLEHYRIMAADTLEQGIATAQEVKAIALLIRDADPLPASAGDWPIVVHCDLPDADDTARALGADQLLVKPVSRRQLLAALDRLGWPVRRVLIADDDPEVVRLFQRMLRGRIAPGDCLEAYNGAEALAILQSEHPDVMLLDLAMPELDGQGVLARLSSDATLPRVPVIVISAKAQDYAALRVPGPIQIQRPQGFQMGEIVRTLEGIFTALAPGWHQGV